MTTKNVVIPYHIKFGEFLKEDPPIVAEKEVDPNKRAVLDAWKQGNFLCKNYILTGFNNALYNV